LSNTFETTDPELALHLLRHSHGDGVRVVPRSRPGWIRADQAPLTPAVRLDQVSLECSFDVQANPLGVLALVQLRSGRASYGSCHSERHYGPGDVFLIARPEHPYTSRCVNYDVAVTVISPAVLGRVAATAPGRSPQPVRLTRYEPVGPAAAGRWQATFAYVRNEILGVPQAAVQPLLVAAAERLLLATLLAAFPNNALTDPTIEDRHDAHPATLTGRCAFSSMNRAARRTVGGCASRRSSMVGSVSALFGKVARALATSSRSAAATSSG